MRIGKILALVVGGLAALLVLALLAVWLLVNPNEFKPRIAAAVKEATGRDLTLAGDLKLSVFPWIALQLGQASLGNPPGFAGPPFLTLNRASVRVKVLPLLAKRLDIGRIEIDGLEVTLVKDAQGHGNWEGLSKGGAAPSTPAAAPSKSGATLEDIAGVKITNARVSYGSLTAQHITFETGSFADRGRVPVSLHLDADRGIAGEQASLDARFELSADTVADRFALAALNVNGMVALAGHEPERLSLSVPAVELNLAAQTLAAPAFSVNVAGAQVTGSVQGTQVVDAPDFRGTVTLAPLSVREFLPRLGMAAPATRDPKALSEIGASGDFTYGASAAKVEHLKATLDDTHLTGSLGLSMLATEAITFDLAVDSINLDRYLPPPAAGTPPRAAPAASPSAAKSPLEANGTLTVGALHVSPLDLTDVKVTVATHDQVMRIHPLTAQVDGGAYSGDITWDTHAAIPEVSMDEHLTGIDVGKLAAQETHKLHVTGRGNVNVKGTAHGATADAIEKSLDGHFDMTVANGAVEGVDLGYELGRAEALLQHQEAPATQDTKRTAFDAFKMSAAITNGIAATKDLLISSAALKITGQGTVNLPASALDLALVADTLKTVGNVPLQIPVKVTGSLADPTVRPDVEALAKSELKKKVQDVLQDKLKGLFK